MFTFCFFRFGINLSTGTNFGSKHLVYDFETPNDWAHIMVNLKKNEFSVALMSIYVNGALISQLVGL